MLSFSRVTSDALFSYQPPFNLFAFLILWPLSRILTPRALHSTNVFLIKLTVSSLSRRCDSSYNTLTSARQSFPWLIAIAIYERYLAQGRHFRESSTTTAQDLASSVFRGVKRVPFLESLVGSRTTDLYDAIFDVDDPEAYELFASDEDEDGRPALTATLSRDSLRPPSPGSGTPRQQGARRATSLRSFRAPRSPRSPTRGSPVMRSMALPDLVEPHNSAEIQTVGPRSPLSRLFTGRAAGRRAISASHERLAPLPNQGAAAAAADERVRRLEGLVEEIRGLPVNRLKEEMKELQVRRCWVGCGGARAETTFVLYPGSPGADREPSHDAHAGHEKRDVEFVPARVPLTELMFAISPRHWTTLLLGLASFQMLHCSAFRCCTVLLYSLYRTCPPLSLVTRTCYVALPCISICCLVTRIHTLCTVLTVPLFYKKGGAKTKRLYFLMHVCAIS